MTIGRTARRLIVTVATLTIVAAFASRPSSLVRAQQEDSNPTAQQGQPRRSRPGGRRAEPQPAPPVYTGVPGSIAGTIEDQLGELMSGVAVHLADATGNVRTVETTSSAAFEFGSLPPGAYALQLMEPGFAPTYVDVAIGEGERLTRDIVVEVETLEETLHITPSGVRTPPVPHTELERFFAARNAAATPTSSSGRCGRPPACVTPARKVLDRVPQYPAEAASLGIEGLVVLDARITREGLVDSVHPLIADNDALRDAAVSAVRQWQFEAARLNGIAVEMPLSLTVEFSLK
jgi:TonB family protein